MRSFISSKYFIGSLAILLFLAASLPIALVFRAHERNFDEGRCYYPNVEGMAAKFPRVSLLEDSLTSAPPGYFHLLGGVTRLTGASTAKIRLNHLAITTLGILLCMVLLSRWVKREAWSFIPFLPLFLGTYFIKQSYLISTDNIALMLCLLILAMLLFAPKTIPMALCAGGLAIYAVYVRQTTIWLAAPMGIPLLMRMVGVERKEGNWGRELLLVTSAAACGAFIVLLYFTWGGLLPERWRAVHFGWTLAGPLYAISLAGILTPFFTGVRSLFSKDSFKLAGFIGVVFGVLLFLLAPSTYDNKHGRWGGFLWTMAQDSPIIAGHALLFLPLLIFGFFCLGVLFIKLWKQDRFKAVLWGVAFVAWIVSTIPNSHIFHRYFEGYVLLFLGFWAIMETPDTFAGRAKIYILTFFLFFYGIVGIYLTDNGFRSGPISALLK